MKIKISTLLLLVLFNIASFAQDGTIRGVVADQASNVKLKNATISVLNAKDSTLYNFTRADHDGKFEFQNFKDGKFILLVTYPEYADFVNQFSIEVNKKIVDFDVIDMKTKAKLLNEVLIKGQAAAIKIKGDTTEFNAAAYNIKPNDRVEDLIKQFPGIQVDANGQITAQGKTVEKVLVDGEEFFGDDPTLVTKNLRADMVDKVQLFEKSSDQAAFTGVDDGQKKQTLNIVLKEDKKNGYFGKLEAGYGNDDFYALQGMFNKFRGKEKISAYGTSSNTGKTGLDWEDASKYGASSNMSMSDDGGMMFFGSSDNMFDNGSYYGEGLPRAHNGGLHYENKWNKDKESINSNYKIGGFNIRTNKNTITQNNLPGNIFNSNSDNNSESNNFRQKLDATYQINLDSTSNLKVIIDGSITNSDKDDFYSSESRREDNSLLNNSERSNTGNQNQTSFNINATYMKKLKKIGRNYSLNIINNLNQTKSDGYLKATNNFFDANENATRTDVTDQFRNNDISSNNLRANFTYNEPLSKVLTLTANYGVTLSNNTADKKTYDASALDVYENLNTEFSNNFKSDQFTNQVGAVFNYKKAKTTVTFGTKASFINFDQTEVYTNQKFNRNFMNWLPQASYQYKFSSQKSLAIRYNGSNTQPTVSQLQPVRTNDDPLNIPEGNPDLEPSFNNRLNLNFNSYKVLTSENIYVGLSFGFTNNQIVSNNNTSAEGVTIYRSVNMENKIPTNYSGWGGYSRKIKALGNINAGIQFNFNGNTNYNYVNNVLNTTISQSYSPNLYISKYNDKFSLHLNFGPSYNAQEASLQKQFSNKGWGRNGGLFGTFKLPQKFGLEVNGNYTYTPKSAAFDTAFEQTIINAALTKAFYKEETLKIKLSANDILNENRGFRRFASANTITQSNFNNISRYFLFSLIWDFNKMGGSTAVKK
jgi:hypothetical protein